MDYRSLMINSSAGITLASGTAAPIRHQGAGRLDLSAALANLLSVEPTSVQFGVGSGAVRFTRDIVVRNLSATDSLDVTVRVAPFEGTIAPTLDTASLQLAGASQGTIRLSFSGDGAAGEHQGFVLLTNQKNEVVTRIPYWYGARSAEAKAITVLGKPNQGKAGQAVVFGARVVDGGGIDVDGADLKVAAMTPGAEVMEVGRLDGIPGVIGIAVRLVPGANTFSLAAGGMQRLLEIEGQ